MKYTVKVNLEEIGVFSTYRLAVKALWDKVGEEIEAGRMSLQGLETCTWIEEDGLWLKDFYTARDEAIDNGWAVDGKWVE